jgi:hypothetical protein
MAVSNKIFFPTFISSINYEPVRTLPHIYFYNGLKSCEEYFIQHYASGSTNAVNVDSQSAFPYFDYYDGVIPNGDSNSLLFFNELPAYGETPSGSLYTEYWETYVSLLYNPRTRLFKASAIIPLADYFEMELNDIVQWRGNYYHLRAINDYNLKDGTCNIELLGPIIRDAVDRGPEPIPPGPPETCVFEFSSSYEGVGPSYIPLEYEFTTSVEGALGAWVSEYDINTCSEPYILNVTGSYAPNTSHKLNGFTKRITLGANNMLFGNYFNFTNLNYPGTYSVYVNGILVDGPTTANFNINNQCVATISASLGATNDINYDIATSIKIVMDWS